MKNWQFITLVVLILIAAGLSAYQILKPAQVIFADPEPAGLEPAPTV